MTAPTARERAAGAEALARRLRDQLDALDPALLEARHRLEERIARLDKIARDCRARDVAEAVAALPEQRHRADVDG